MYHVAVGVARADEHLTDKVDTVRSLPTSEDSTRVTVVHISDGTEGETPAVAKALQALESAGITADVHRAEAEDSPRTLVEVVDELEVDLLCIGGRRRSPAGKLQLKPGAKEVILNAACPVVVAGTVASREPRK